LPGTGSPQHASRDYVCGGLCGIHRFTRRSITANISSVITLDQ
jgi:hypothetical protein